VVFIPPRRSIEEWRTLQGFESENILQSICFTQHVLNVYIFEMKPVSQ